MLVLLFGQYCKQKHITPDTRLEPAQPVPVKRNMTLRKLGELMFRRSYASFEKMTREEQKALFEQPPYLMRLYDTVLYNRFRKIGLTKDEALLLNKLKTDTATIFNLERNEQDKVHIQASRDSFEGDVAFVIAHNPNDCIDVRLYGMLCVIL